MPSLEDWINNPLVVIDFLLDQNKEPNNSIVKDYFSEKLKTKNASNWIPSLNDTALDSLRNNTLVRYRCMIQDMFDPEFYLGTYEVKDCATGNTGLKSGKYRDIVECSINQKIDLKSKNNVTMDRMTLYCVPIPGEAEWVKKANANFSKLKTRCYPSTSAMPARCKRLLDDDESGAKRLKPEVNGQMDDNGANVCGDSNTNIDIAVTSEAKCIDVGKHETMINKKVNLNFPLPGESGPACLVKLYDDIDKFKVNDIIEFIGVLSVDPSQAYFPDDSEDSPMGVAEPNLEESIAHEPPPSLVPRLHAVVCRHLDHVNPLIPENKSEDHQTILNRFQTEVTALRQEILTVLEHSLFGDKLAAEYLLCYLMASVYGRADAMPLGKFNINLSNCPPVPLYAKLLHHLVTNIGTQSHILHMSLENMNQCRFSPHKDYSANRLCSGILQLAKQTNFVVDETSLQPGQLDNTGVENIRALADMISWQKVMYDFGYHKQEFPCDISALVISEGKSILPSDCHIPLQYVSKPDNLQDHFAILDPILTEDFLTKCRTFIGLGRTMEYMISEDMQKYIQDDFVNLRKDDPKRMTVDDFHGLLSLTRVLSLSELKACPTAELWKHAKQMEIHRKCRLVSQQQPC